MPSTICGANYKFRLESKCWRQFWGQLQVPFEIASDNLWWQLQVTSKIAILVISFVQITCGVWNSPTGDNFFCQLQVFSGRAMPATFFGANCNWRLEYQYRRHFLVPIASAIWHSNAGTILMTFLYQLQVLSRITIAVKISCVNYKNHLEQQSRCQLFALITRAVWNSQAGDNLLFQLQVESEIAMSTPTFVSIKSAI